MTPPSPEKRGLGLKFWINAVLACVWLVMVPVSIYTGLRQSVPYLVALSVYALFVGHLSSAIAAHADAEARRSREDA